MNRFLVVLALLVVLSVPGQSMEFSGNDNQSYGFIEAVDKLVITEDITLKDNAVLTFYNISISMAPTTDWQYTIEVKDNARLILDTAKINISNQKKLRVNITGNGVLELRNSELEVTELLINSENSFQISNSYIDALTSINTSSIMLSDSTINSWLYLRFRSHLIEIKNSNVFNDPTSQPSKLLIEGGTIEITDSVIENRLNQYTELSLNGGTVSIENSIVNNTALKLSKVLISSAGNLEIVSSEVYSLSNNNESEVYIYGSDTDIDETPVIVKGKFAKVVANSTNLDLLDSKIWTNGTERSEISAEINALFQIIGSNLDVESEDMCILRLSGGELMMDRSILSSVSERRVGTSSQMRFTFNSLESADSQLLIQDGSSSGVEFISDSSLKNTTINNMHSLFQNEIQIYGDSLIQVYWYAIIDVKDLLGEPITGVNVEVIDPLSTILLSERWTDSDGIAMILLKGEEVTSKKDTFVGNYKVKISYDGELQSKSITLDNTQKVIFTLPVQLRTDIKEENISIEGPQEQESDDTGYWIALILGFVAVGLALLKIYVKAKTSIETRKSSKEYLKQMREKEQETITGPKLEL